MKMTLRASRIPFSRLMAVAAAFSAALVLLAAGLWGYFAFNEPSASSTRDHSQEIKRVRYGFILRNPTGRAVHNAVLWTYAPLKRTSFQTCRNIRATKDFHRQLDSRGHQILTFRFPLVPPYGSKQVTVRAELAMRNSPRAVPRQGHSEWSTPGPFIQSAARTVASRASRLQTQTEEGTLQNILGWINREIDHTGYTSRELGALHALKHREGDCTEFADLYAALARASGIPTRVMAGFVRQGSGALHISGYHNWAESLYGERWHLADPQKNRLDQAAPRYIAMSILDHTDNHPIPRGQPFALRGRGLEIEMK